MAVPSRDDLEGTFSIVNDLVVLAPFRDRGIGRALLEAATTVATKAGATELLINALSGNAGAVRLYERTGFVPLDVTLRRTLP